MARTIEGVARRMRLGPGRDILTVARTEFTEHGLSGARVDAIAEKTRTTKRMIYYYFGSKEGSTPPCWSRPMPGSESPKRRSGWTRRSPKPPCAG